MSISECLLGFELCASYLTAASRHAGGAADAKRVATEKRAKRVVVLASIVSAIVRISLVDGR